MNDRSARSFPLPPSRRDFLLLGSAGLLIPATRAGAAQQVTGAAFDVRGFGATGQATAPAPNVEPAPYDNSQLRRRKIQPRPTESAGNTRASLPATSC